MDPNGAIEIVYPNDNNNNNNNNNNIIIIIIIIIKNHQKDCRRQFRWARERVWRREERYFYFSSLRFFLKSMKIVP